MKNRLEHSFLGFLYRIGKTLLTILLLIVLAVVLVQRFSNNQLGIAGYRIFNVASGSMMPKYEVGDILLTKEKKAEDIRKGDDLVYVGEVDDFAGKIVSHQVVEVLPKKDGEYHFRTKGINNLAEDPIVAEHQILGVVSPKLVLLSFIGRVMVTPLGYYSLFLIVIIMVSIQIVRCLFLDREEKEDEEEDGGREENNERTEVDDDVETL